MSNTLKEFRENLALVSSDKEAENILRLTLETYIQECSTSILLEFAEILNRELEANDARRTS